MYGKFQMDMTARSYGQTNIDNIHHLLDHRSPSLAEDMINDNIHHLLDHRSPSLAEDMINDNIHHLLDHRLPSLAEDMINEHCTLS